MSNNRDDQCMEVEALESIFPEVEGKYLNKKVLVNLQVS